MSVRGRMRGRSGAAAHAERLELRMLLSGTWTPLVHTAPGQVGTMLLLPSGSVIATLDGDNAGSDWGLLTPDATGSYINGTWTKLANANDTRLFDASQVLPDGRLFVAGGEYGTGAATGETYNPLTNTWTRLPSQSFGSFIDANSILLPNGNVMIAPVAPNPAGYTTIFNPTTNSWSQGPKLYRGSSADEDSWVKLSDDSIILTDGNGTSERYIPALNQWINDGTVPVSLFDGLDEEGAGIRLADGRAFFLGATGHTAIYTPSGSTAPGSWVAGPDIPGGHGTDDAPLAMLPDGTVLCAVGPSGNYNGPTVFYIYDPIANTFSAVANAPSVVGPPFLSRMLDLPDGNVLYTSGTSTLYEYKSGTTPLAAAKPTITALTPNADGSVTLSGTGLNGLDAGAAYGDDAQMDGNYPIVRLTAGSSIYYARTYGWTSTSVATGTLVESTHFTLPLGIPAGTYSVSTIANGVASDPATLTLSMIPNNLAPTVATPAAASASPVTGTTTNLSVLGADDAGESNLTYTWTTSSGPSGASLPSFSVNGTHAAQNTVATFYRAGTYTFNVFITDSGGLSTSSSATVTVSQTERSLQLTPAVSTLTADDTGYFSAQAMDQFGVALSSQPGFSWSVLSGGGSINTTGQYSAPAAGTLASIGVADATFSASAQVGVVDAPWTSVDVGSVGKAGIAYDPGGAFTVAGSGADVWGTSDAFQFVYQPFAGNGMITARVTGVQNTNAWAKAGVMIRNSTAAGAQYAFMALSPGNGAALQDRVTSGGSAAQVSNTTGLAAPYWVRLIRSGSTITGYISSDGIKWSNQGSVTIPTMATTANFGLAVTAHNNSALCTATFSNVTVTSPFTTTTLAASGPNPSNATQPLTFTAAVSGGVPDGDAVTLQDANNGNQVVASGALSSGSATLTVPAGALSAGTHNLVAVYSGDTNFAASQSAPYPQAILPNWLSANGQATWDAATHTLTVTGAAVINADPGADEPNIVESGAAAQLVIQPATSPTDIHVGGISLSNGAKLQVASVGAGRTHSNHDVLVVGTLGAATDPTFAIDPTSKLDLADNDLVLHAGSSDANGTAAYNSVYALAKSGRNSKTAATPDGTWDGFGLDSSAATAVFNAQGYEQVALGVVDNNQLVFGALSQWSVGSASENLGANDVLVKYTYVGDYALEGMVGDDNAGILQVEYDHGARNTHNWATGSTLWDGLADDNEAGVFQIQYGLGTGGKNGAQL